MKNRPQMPHPGCPSPCLQGRPFSSQGNIPTPVARRTHRCYFHTSSSSLGANDVPALWQSWADSPLPVPVQRFLLCKLSNQ